MKHRNSLLITTALSLLMYGCGEAYLEKRPLGQLDETELASKSGVEGLLIAAYSLLDGIGSSKSGIASAASNWIYGSICGSEAYKGSLDFDASDIITPLELFMPTAINSGLASKWGTVYDGVQRANDVLRILPKATDLTVDDQKRMTAEARFLRAHYHFEAKKIWNKIPYIDETVTYAAGNYRVSNEKDSWPFIENDLKYAVDNLAITPYNGAVGRANKYSAMAMLAKVYLFQQKFAAAKPLIEAIINSGQYQLVNYGDNFNPASKNSKESILSAQTSVNDGSMGQNSNFGDVLNFPMGAGPGGCCGFFQPSQYLVNHFKTNPATGLPDLDNFNVDDVTNDQGYASSDPFTPYAGTLDARLDWTVGRRGIPYLDWGIYSGKDWVRDQNYFGPYSPKKNVFYKSQQGQLTDNSFWTSGAVANNVNLIRYADVLLWAAEVEIEIGDLNKGRDYINTVRARAADPSRWVKAADGSPAANYKVGLYTAPWSDQAFARKAVRYERMLELGMEGHRFFDLVRWGIADTEINAYLQKEKIPRKYLADAKFTKNKNEYFPIPQIQRDLSAGPDGVPALIQNPGY